MKKHKTLTAFIILILLIGIFLAFTSYTNILSYMEFSSHQELKISGMLETIQRVEEHIKLMESDYLTKINASTEMMVLSLRQFVTENGYEGPEFFEDGIVVSVKNGSLVYPENSPVKIPDLETVEDISEIEPLSEFMITSDDWEDHTVFVTVKPISGNLYYIDWTEKDDYLSSVNYEKYFEEAIPTLEQAYDVYLILVADQGTDLSLMYHSANLGEIDVPADIGLTEETEWTELTAMKFGSRNYSATAVDITFLGQPAKAIILSDPASSNTYVDNCLFIAAGFTLLCMTGMILWIHWVRAYVQDHTLTDSQKKAYNPISIRRTSMAVGINGAIFLFLLLIGYSLLGNLSRISRTNQQMIGIIQARLQNDSIHDSLYQSDTEEWELYYSQRAAELYAKNPELRTSEFLAEVNKLISSEYIMTFDGKGKEQISSNSYVGFTLGKDIPGTEDFRYLLQGIDYIIHEPEEDIFTGKMIQLIGVRTDLDDDNSYEAMVFAFDSQAVHGSSVNHEIAAYVNMLTPQGYLSFIIDKENDTILYTSDPDFSGKTMKDLGAAQNDMIPTSLETFEILGEKKYGAYNEDDQYRYYYMMNTDNLWGGTVKYAAFSAAAYLLICIVIRLFLLGPFRLNFTEEAARAKEMFRQRPGKRLDKNTIDKMEAEILDNFQNEDISERFTEDWWRDQTPEKKTIQLMKLMATLVLIIIIAILFDRNEFSSNSVINFILNGTWRRGLNDLALAAILCVAVIIMGFILLKDFIVRILCSIMNPKGETIIRLISSLLQYISIIAGIFVCLAYLGFDTSVLATSASILTLAISLGSKDLVADILAGIFIIFEGDFHVGDVIEVNGYSGRVLEIGGRSTKLKDSYNNIKIIDNQSVKNILNKSKDASWCFITLTITNNQPLDEIEAMLERELPEIGKQNPKILSGPTYMGISEIAYRRLTLSIACMCQQKDLKKIKRSLNHSLWEMFEKNGFQL